MSEVAGPGVATRDPEAERPPRRADGVTLIGEMRGSGYRRPPALARRGDGQTVQLTPLLYATLAAFDGHRSLREVAQVVSEQTGRTVSEDNVAALLDKLRPLGLLDGAGEGQTLERSNPLLALRFKAAVTDPERTRRLTAPFARLFSPLVAVPVLAAFAWISWWVLFRKGLASATHEAFARPGLLLAVLVVTVLSAGFHEFGHAAGTRRGGATPGVMGVGLYLIWPAFYTDVTDSYRLGRGGRLRTDLGGLYFNAIVTVLTVGVWLVSGYDAILLVVATQILQMLRQLLPLVRFDGYHVLADLTGVPDLFQRIGPTLKGLVPGLKRDPAAMALKPWARTVITAWVLTVVPVLAFVLVMLVLTLPRVVGTALHAAESQREAMLIAADGGSSTEVVARAVAMVVVLLPVAASAYMLARLARRVGGVWRRTRGRPVRRGLAVLVAAALVAGLAYAWWPSGERYRPIQAYEGGTLTDALSLARPATGLGVGAQGSGTIALPHGAAPPTRGHPLLATVLVPTDGAGSHPAGTATGGGTGTSGTTTPGTQSGLTTGEVDQAAPDTWIFPFDQPPAPDADDNQAMAVNTTDGTTTYDVAFALVWADGDDPVQTDNSAYALASCRDCAAVAVSFQVVLVVGHAVAVAPENISVAASYDCSSCLTFSLAVQLFVTLDGPLSDTAMSQLEELWSQVVAFGQNIGDVPLDQIQDTLSGFETDILAIIEQDQGPLTPPSTTPSPSASASPDQAAEPTETSGTSGAAAPSASATATGSASASPSPSMEPSGSGSASTSPSASASPSASDSVTSPDASASPASGALTSTP